MLSVAHATTGALLATKISSPPLVVALILASHYLEDRVYHWDAGTGMGSGYKPRHLAILHELVDLALTVLVVVWLFPTSRPVSLVAFLSLPQVWGSLLALLPDFLEAPRNFLHYEPVWLKPLNRFHKSFHRSTPHIISGLAPQLLLLTLIYLLR